MNKIKCLTLLLIAFIVVSCGKKSLPVSTIEREYGLEEFDFEYLQTKSKVKFSSEDKSLSSAAVIRMKKDSIIWVSLSPLFGIEAARGFISQDTIVFLNRVDKEVHRYNYETLSKMLNFKVDFQMIQSIILGNQVLDFKSEDKFSKKRGELLIDQLRQRFQIQTVANEKLRKVSTIRVTELPDGSDMKIVFDDFTTVSGQAFPFQSLVTVLSKTKSGAEMTTVELNHSKVDVGSSPLSFPFSVSSKYED